MKTSGNTIVVTGGGSGIGRALAQRWHDAGNVVIVTGRTATSLDETIAGYTNMHAMVLDVSDQHAITAFAADVVKRFPALNVLVNNAGIMRSENLGQKRDLVGCEDTIATNLFGPIRLTDALVDHLVAQRDGAIVNVTSGLAFVPLANVPTYCATKAGLHSYTISLRHQLTGPVEVIEIAPPGVRTELTPGQSLMEMFITLDDFADEVMALLAQQPTPPEVIVSSAKDIRYAEREGRLDRLFSVMNQPR